MNRLTGSLGKTLWASGLALLAGAALSASWVKGNAQPPADDGVRTVVGKVKEYTTAPRGEIDGAVLEDGTVLHWPPHLQERFGAVAARGDRVRATGRAETGPEGDTHFEVRSLRNERTRAAAGNDDETPPPPPRGGPRGRRPAPPPEGERKTVTGKAKEFTTAPRGEVDGAVLDDGTVLHWPPHLQDRFQGLMARGDRVRATGRMETGPEGDAHLEVREVTNLRTRAVRSNDDTPPPPPVARRPAPERPAADRPGDPDSRLRELERKVDHLQREIERLRREKK